MEQKSNRQIIYERLWGYVQDKYKQIDVEMGEYHGDKMCQHHAAQNVYEGKCEYAVSVLSFTPKSGVNVHFINKMSRIDPDTGKIVYVYIDNTLGYLSRKNIYFLLQIYDLKQIEKLNMSKLLTEWKEKALSWVFTKAELNKFGITLSNI